MILTLIGCLGLQILLLTINVMRYYAVNDRPALTLAVFQIFLITFIVHTLGDLI